MRRGGASAGSAIPIRYRYPLIRLSRDVAGEREDHAHRLVPEVSRRTEHARAAAVDHGDPLLSAVVRRRLGDASSAWAAVHPNVLDPELSALTHRLFGDLRPGADHDRLDTAGNRAEIVIGTITLDLVGVRIHRERLVAALAKALVDDVAPVTTRVS